MKANEPQRTSMVGSSVWAVESGLHFVADMRPATSKSMACMMRKICSQS